MITRLVSSLCLKLLSDSLSIENYFANHSNTYLLFSVSVNMTLSCLQVSLSSAVHKSFIDVNEEGSEAAAATALFGFRSARPLFHTDFIANHPFLFLVSMLENLFFPSFLTLRYNKLECLSIVSFPECLRVRPGASHR